MKINIILLIILILSISVYADVSGIITNIEIHSKYLKVTPGSSVLAATDIIIIKQTTEPIDIVIEYKVYDQKNNTIIKFSETKGTVIRINTIKEFKIPDNSELGTYTIEVKTSYSNINNIGYAKFEVVKENYVTKFGKEQTQFLILSILVLVIFIGFIFQYQKFKNIEKLINQKNNKGSIFMQLKKR